MSQQHTFESKPDEIQVESVIHEHDEVDEKAPAERDIVLKSSLDNLGMFSAIATFRNAILICGLASFSSALDGKSGITDYCAFLALTSGYQNQLSGSIIANPGFINQFAADHKKLNATHVSTFGGLFSAGQVIGQASVPFISERFGRKIAMYYFCIILLVVSDTRVGLAPLNPGRLRRVIQYSMVALDYCQDHRRCWYWIGTSFSPRLHF